MGWMYATKQEVTCTQHPANIDKMGHLVSPDGVGAVVDVEHVVAVDLESLEPDHEPLEDGLL